MSRLLRGHVLQAVSAASTGAIRLASIQGVPDEAARVAIDDAVNDLIKAVIVALESIGIGDDEVERRRLYRDLGDYVDGLQTYNMRQLGGASSAEARP